MRWSYMEDVLADVKFRVQAESWTSTQHNECVEGLPFRTWSRGGLGVSHIQRSTLNEVETSCLHDWLAGPKIDAADIHE